MLYKTHYGHFCLRKLRYIPFDLDRYSNKYCQTNVTMLGTFIIQQSKVIRVIRIFFITR